LKKFALILLDNMKKHTQYKILSYCEWCGKLNTHTTEEHIYENEISDNNLKIIKKAKENSKKNSWWRKSA
jgi:hypothetical protein